MKRIIAMKFKDSSCCVYHLPDRQRAVSFASVHLPLRYRVPAEVELPVESSVCHVRACHVLKGIIADNVDNGAHHCCPTVNRNPSAHTHAHTNTVHQPAVHNPGWTSIKAKSSSARCVTSRTKYSHKPTSHQLSLISHYTFVNPVRFLHVLV